MLEKISSYFRRKTNKAPQQLAVYLTADTVSLLRVSARKVSQCTTVSYKPEQWQAAVRTVVADLPAVAKLDVVLAPEFYQLVQLDKPALTEEELRLALPWQVKDLVTIPAEDMVADYIDLPGQSAPQAKINVVVARLSWLKQLVQCISNSGLQLSSVQPAEWLAHHLIAASPQPCMLIIHQPGQEVLLQIVQGGQLYFSRRTRGLYNLHLLNAQDARSDMLERLLLELQRSMDYFESQLKQPPVRDIRILAQQPDFLCKLLSENGFVRGEPLASPLQLGAYSNEFVQCWPAIAATVSREAQS
ncbi:hypothetical protein [Rheinheimera gaetbuli]